MPDEIDRKIAMGQDEPISDEPLGEVPDNPKSLAELAVEHPEWGGLQQVASYLYQDNPHAFSEARAGRPPPKIATNNG